MSRSKSKNIISLVIALVLAVCLFYVDTDELMVNGSDACSSSVITSNNGSVSFDISTKAENTGSVCELICAYGNVSYRSIFRYDKPVFLLLFIFAVLLFLYVRFTAISYQAVNHSQFFIINYIHNLDGMKS